MAQILVLLKYTVTWRMEVAMSILKHQKLITLFGLSLLMFLSSPAQAQWPTLDLTAIKEGISSKIELVKQSKIVTEATKLGGKMNWLHEFVVLFVWHWTIPKFSLDYIQYF